MALLYAEKFAKYTDDQHIIDDNTPSTITSSGSTSRTIEVGQGRFGDNVLQMASASAVIEFPWAAVTASTTIIVGFSMRAGTLANGPARQDTIMAVATAADAIHWRLDWIPGGLLLYRASAVPVLVGVATDCIATDRWHWIEVKASMATAGNVEVRVDGVTVLNVAADFRSGTSDALTRFRMFGDRFERQYDEIIICDGAGSTFNDFFGDTRIVQAVPDADGSVVDWTASAGTDVSCVDDAIAGYNGDTDYISSSTADQESLFSHASFTLTGLNSVKFVQLSTMARDDGTNTFRQLVRSGGTTYDNGADINPVSNTVYDWYNTRRELNPNGAIAWTETSINAAEFGVRARP